MNILLTGTPGTGKTKVAEELGKKGYEIIDLKPVIEKYKTGFDRKLKCKIVDEKKLGKEIDKILKKKDNAVVESHLSHFSKKNIVFVLRCDIKELKKRLEKRGYSKNKINENITAEIMQVILDEAVKKGHKVIEIDTTGKTAKKSAEEVINFAEKYSSFNNLQN